MAEGASITLDFSAREYAAIKLEAKRLGLSVRAFILLASMAKAAELLRASQTVNRTENKTT